MAYGAILNQTISGGGRFSYPIIQVSAPTGDTITLTKGGKTITGVEETGQQQGGGLWVLRPWEYGTYVVADSTTGKTQTVEVSEVTLYLISFSIILPILNDNSWQTIRQASDDGVASSSWSVGDAKQITINATIGTKSYSDYQPWVYILAFNHNASLEGNNLTHFGCFRSEQEYSEINGIALDDSEYGSGTSTQLAFHMNTTNTNTGGWQASIMRTAVLNSNVSNPSSALANSFLAALPSDLKVVLKQCTKYSDNTGGGNDTSSYVTATQDWVFLLSEFEVQGTRTYANSAEQTKQLQYEYYINGNSKIKYKQSSTSTTLIWWLRSVYATNTNGFCYVNTSGSASSNAASFSYGLAPCFCV